MTYKEKLLDPRWQKRRLQILQRDKWRCTWCGNKNLTLHVHHFSYPKGKEIWEVDDSVLTTLCELCHSINHNKKIPESIKELLGYLYCNKAHFITIQCLNLAILELLEHGRMD